MAGIGLSGFLNPHGSGKRKFLFNWKKRGYVDVWIHINNKEELAWPSWIHSFIRYGSYKDKETGRDIECLNYPNYVSPDSFTVNENQFFRNQDDSLQIKPYLDPFLLFREWLRCESELSNDTVVFKWTNPNPRKDINPIIEWNKGHLSRLVSRGKFTYMHSLDSKLIYYFVVIDNENPSDGPQILKTTKLLGDCIRKEINRQIMSNGESGNPLISPYAFRLQYNDDVKNIMDTYEATRYNRAIMTPDINSAITAPDYPDPTPDCESKPNDKYHIRADMEAAAQIEIPWDKIFVDDWRDNTGTVADDNTCNITRRRKKNDTIATVKCDDCDAMIPINASKCDSCGTEYEIDSSSKVSNDSGNYSSNKTKASRCFSCNGEMADYPTKVAGEYETRCVSCGLGSVDGVDDLPF
jgi:hypothetical protein